MRFWWVAPSVSQRLSQRLSQPLKQAPGKLYLGRLSCLGTYSGGLILGLTYFTIQAPGTIQASRLSFEIISQFHSNFLKLCVKLWFQTRDSKPVIPNPRPILILISILPISILTISILPILPNFRLNLKFIWLSSVVLYE